MASELTPKFSLFPAPQSPKADVVFSQSCCIFTRDGTPHLCLRLGNLRCHTLFNPHIRLFLLRDHETAEGESFVRIQEIKVDLPGTVSGVYSVTHKIDEDSPLREAARVMASGGAIQEELLAIQCTFTALDPVYQVRHHTKKKKPKANLLKTDSPPLTSLQTTQRRLRFAQNTITGEGTK